VTEIEELILKRDTAQANADRELANVKACNDELRALQAKLAAALKPPPVTR
jgi:hypothetical protein